MMTSSRALVGLLLFAAPSALSASDDADRLQSLVRLSKLPRRNFLNGVMKMQRELDLQNVDLAQDGEEEEEGPSFIDVVQTCGNAVGALRDPIAAVADTCGMAIGDLFNIENIEDLLGLCGNQNLEDCTNAVQDLVAEAEPQFETCLDAINEFLADRGIDTEFEVPEELSEIAEALDGSLLQQAVCMASDISDDAIECAGSLQDFIGENAIDAIGCFREFVNQEEECSAECTALANTFVDEVGCCATGLVYSLNVDALLMRFANTSVDAVSEDLTACGVELFGCDELENLFADNQLEMLQLPAPLQEETMAPTTPPMTGEGEGEGEDNGEDNGQAGNSSAAATITVTSSIVVLALSVGTALF